MPSPVSRERGGQEANLATWLNVFRSRIAALYAGSNVTTLLGEASEVQPDAQLHVLPEHGGRTRVQDGYVAGAPELVVEVARTTRGIDLGAKRAEYERAGVLEYLVVAINPDEVHWFVLRDGKFDRLSPGPDGLFRSEAFPGLWLDPLALFRDDVAGLLAAVTRGKETEEHLAFAQALAGRLAE